MASTTDSRRASSAHYDTFSSLSHLAGVVAVLFGLPPLLAAARGDPWLALVGSVFVAAVVIAFGASALYHLLDHEEDGNGFLRRLDHAAIFVLIAGTYTPIAFAFLEGGWRWSVLGVQWGVALLGISIKLFRANLPRVVTVTLYLAMGWFALVPLKILWRTMPTSGLYLMFAGGVAYTIGAIIYARKRPDPLPTTVGFHGLFHLFTLAGAGFHYALVYLALASAGS